MELRYTLALDDHLAWYDYYLATPEGKNSRSRFPIIGGLLNKRRRRKYSREIISPPNRHAFGERTLEVSDDGVREFTPEFAFTTKWANISLVTITSSHLFLADTSMNAHIIPLHFFENETKRDLFISFVKSHAKISSMRA